MNYNYSYPQAVAGASSSNDEPAPSVVGMQLMQKMGWKPGEGLGKNSHGATEALSVKMKLNKRGLAARGERIIDRGKMKRPPVLVASDLKGKHPVTALMELCTMKRWMPPKFTCFESGGIPNKLYRWNVQVNGVTYESANSSSVKKEGKAFAATVALQTLGLVPPPTT